MHLELFSSLIPSCITWFKIMSLVTCTQLTIAIDCFAFLTPGDGWKPQASSHVMGPCRQFISGQKVLWLSLPTDILLLSLAVLLPFLCSPLLAHAALQLTVTEHLEGDTFAADCAQWLQLVKKDCKYQFKYQCKYEFTSCTNLGSCFCLLFLKFFFFPLPLFFLPFFPLFLNSCKKEICN